MARELRRVAVIGGVRIPFCRSNTFYADQSNLDMMAASLNGLVDRYGLKGSTSTKSSAAPSSRIRKIGT